MLQVDNGRKSGNENGNDMKESDDHAADLDVRQRTRGGTSVME